ncbi:alpha/beta hydrolase [Devosia sp. BK]|uniref:RBBP9/YdeN family alpha/beta hydrolase n=1 Tax=Devosia sp. BK TaxID=2871706 RepID=UPI00293B8143|nr:alpha/beta hydrolase [Devosia sp. BK]MDV3250415.1 alpha/beta hydrolase [Devosia sp. BK]
MSRTHLIVPGLNGSGDGHWQHHWMADHEHSELVEQTDWSNPHAGRWLARLERAVIAHPGAILIGHSLGAILIARLASSSVAPLVGGAVLVAPADIERTSTIHARTYEFGTLPTDALPFQALVIASRNDDYMSQEKARSLTSAWGATFLGFGDNGHINIASGFGRWTGGYEFAQQIKAKADRRLRHDIGKGLVENVYQI